MTNDHIFLAVTFAIIFFSVVLHEVAHGYSAFLLGDETAKREGRLTLNPLAHIDPFYTLLMPVITYYIFNFPLAAAKPVPVQPANFKGIKRDMGDVIVSVCGPLTNLAIAIILALGLHWANPEFLVAKILAIGLIFQIFLFFFNMLPIPPLDGSHLVKVLLPRKIRANFEQFIFPLGIPLLIAFILLGGLDYLIDIPFVLSGFIAQLTGTKAIFIETLDWHFPQIYGRFYL